MRFPLLDVFPPETIQKQILSNSSNSNTNPIVSIKMLNTCILNTNKTALSLL